MASWTCDVKWSEDSDELVKFYYRDLKDVAKWLLRQPYHEHNMVYIVVYRIRDGIRW